LPIIGFKCAYDGSDVLFKDCKKCAYSFDNPCNFTYPLIEGMIDREGREPGISTSTIAGCAREMALLMRNDVFIEPPYWAFRGTLGHLLIEKYGRPDTWIEKELKWKKPDGTLITSTPDLVVPDKGKIIEYKTAKKVPRYQYPYKGHTIQLNIQRYMLHMTEGIEAEDLEVQYLDMGETKRCKAKLWAYYEIENYMNPRIEVLKKVLNETYMPPTLTSKDVMFFKCNGYCAVEEICKDLATKERKQELEEIMKHERGHEDD